MTTASWVIIHKPSGRVIMETYRKDMTERLKPEYEAIPILEYLRSLNTIT